MWLRPMTFNLALVLTVPVALCAAENKVTEAREWDVSSPDKRVVLTFRLGEDQRLSWRVEMAAARARTTVLPDAPLGIVREDQRFVENLEFVSATPPKVIAETYELPHGKQSTYQYQANERRFVYRNSAGAQVELVARVFNDAVALRYRFPETKDGVFVITDELTSFKLTKGGNAWMQGILPVPHHVNYERQYAQVTNFATDARYSFPALYQTPDRKAWALITEADLDHDDSGASLKGDQKAELFRIQLSSAARREKGLPWATPWRVVVVGESLADIVESSVVTHLSPPSRIAD